MKVRPLRSHGPRADGSAAREGRGPPRRRNSSFTFSWDGSMTFDIADLEGDTSRASECVPQIEPR